MVQPASGDRQDSAPVSSQPDARTAGRFARVTGVPAWRFIAIGALIVLVGLSLSQFLVLVIRPLALLFAAIIIAEALSPLVDLISRKVPRSLAIVMPYLCVLALISGIGWLIYPTLVSEAERLVERGPELVSQVQEWVNRWDPTGDGRITELATSRLGSAAGVLTSLPFTIVSSVVEVVLVIVMSIYWLFAKPGLREFFLSLFPSSRRDSAGSVLEEIGQTIGGYVRAELLTAILIGLITWVGLSLIGVQYALVLALVAAVGELIPVIGPIVSAVPAIAVALLDSPLQALLVLGFFLVLQQVESNILLPNIMHRQAHIPPLLAIFSLFVGGTIGGILGALVAIPLAGALKVITIRVLAPAIRNWSGADRSSDDIAHEEAT